MTELTKTDKALLDIFGKTWKHYGLKALAIKDASGMTPTEATFYVNVLIESEAAMAYAPLTVKRLLRLRDDRKDRRRRA